jgi:hypothetical protein
MVPQSVLGPGGANVAFVHGSVRWLKSSTTITIVWALDSRSQGEIVSADSYRSVPSRRTPSYVLQVMLWLREYVSVPSRA